MRWSQTFIPTMKEVPFGCRSAQSSIDAASRFYSATHGRGVHVFAARRANAEKGRSDRAQEMDATGALEIFMPALQPIDLFERTDVEKHSATC